MYGRFDEFAVCDALLYAFLDLDNNGADAFRPSGGTTVSPTRLNSHQKSTYTNIKEHLELDVLFRQIRFGTSAVENQLRTWISWKQE